MYGQFQVFIYLTKEAGRPKQSLQQILNIYMDKI